MQSTHSQAGKSDSLVVGSQAGEFPTSHTGASGYEGRPRSRGGGHSCQLRSKLALSAEAAAVCQHLPVSHMGLPGSLGALWKKRVLPATGPRVPVAKPQRVPGALHGQSCTVGGREQAGRSGRAKAEPEGPSATCLDALPPIVSSGLAIGQEGQVGQARKQKHFLWLYCCPFLPSTLPGLPLCLIAGCPGPPGSISCCRPEPDTSYPLHHGPAQPPAS